MGIFLRGEVWWFEYRTRSVRVVRSTGFRRKDRKRAQAVYDAVRLGFRTRPQKSAMEGILGAIYGAVQPDAGLPLASVGRVYENWCRGKGRVVAPQTDVNRRNLLARFVAWADGRGVTDARSVSVAVARDFVAGLRASGLSNKTLRTYAQYLGGIWRAVGQMVGDLHNPWPPACPDDDGSSVRRAAFAPDEERRVLSCARDVGHGWWLASMVSRWTGLRYGDVARLAWENVDLAHRVMTVTPSKTRRHGVRVVIPIAKPLLDALAAELRGRAREEGFVLPEHAVAYPKPMEPPFSDVLRCAGLDAAVYTFHSWRHTFRTRLAEAGVSDEVARRLGGWTNTGMAAHYDHASHLAEMRDAVDRMSATTGA